MLTKNEPVYEAVGLDWYDVVDAVVDGLYEELSPAEAVERALTPALQTVHESAD